MALCAGLCAPLAGIGSPAAGAALCAVAAVAAGALAAAGRAGAALALLALAVALAGTAWGAARLAATAPARLDLPLRVAGTVVVDAPPQPDGYGGLRARAQAEDLRARRALPAARGRPRCCSTCAADEQPPVLGARLRVAGWLQAPASSTSPGWWRAWLARQGIAGRLRPETVVAEGRRGGLAGLRDRWREWAARRAGAGLSGDRAALVRGMALGGGAGLSEGAATAFRDAGLWHLLAVSGQNVTVVALAVLALLRALGVRPARGGGRRGAGDGRLLPGVRRRRVGGAGRASWAASACSPSCARRRASAGTCCSPAWPCCSPTSPGRSAIPGLQLSFAAVAGLFLLAPPLATWLRGWLPGRVADLAAMAGAAGPGDRAGGRWPTSAASRWWAWSSTSWPCRSRRRSSCWPWPASRRARSSRPPGVALAWVAGLGAWGLLMAARAASAIPGAAVDLPAAAAPGLLAVAVGALALSHVVRPGGLPGWVRAVRWRPAAVTAASLAACGWALGRPAPPAPWPAGPAVTALDIGQGDAILLRSPEGAAAVFDTGPPGAPAPVVAALRRAGVRRLDALVLTHDSLDHVGGAIDILARLPVGVVLHPPEPVDGWEPAARAAIATARARGVPVGVLRAGSRLALGRVAGAGAVAGGPAARGGRPEPLQPGRARVGRSRSTRSSRPTPRATRWRRS